MLATDTGTFDNQVWRIHYDGGDPMLVQITMRGIRSSSVLSVTLGMPRSRARINVTYQEQATREFDIPKFIALHRRQVADGSIAKFATIDRAFHEGEQTKSLAATNKELLRQCGQPIPYELDFASIADSEISSPTPCSALLNATAFACKRDVVSRRAVLSQVKKLRCSHSDKNELRLTKGGTVQLNTKYPMGLNREAVYKELVRTLHLGPVVLADSRDRILVFDPDDTYGLKGSLVGTERALYRQRPIRNELGSWDPYAESQSARYNRKRDGFEIACKKEILSFKPVSRERRDQILAKTPRKPVQWKRTEFALARDTRGIYYYVDRYDEAFGGKNYRVFKGPRGQLTETKLIDIVDDSDGKIFATQRGKLRLVLGNTQDQEALWIEGKERHKLVVLPLHENIDLIYTGLGVYDRDTIGTICE